MKAERLAACMVTVLTMHIFGNGDALADVRCKEKGGGPEFGARVVIEKDVRTITWVQEENAKYLRLRFRLAASGDESWYLVVRDADGRAEQVIRREDFAESGTLWTRRIEGDRVRLELVGSRASTSVQLTEYVAMPSNSEDTFYSMVNPASKPKDLHPGGSELAQRLGDPVGMLMSIHDDKSWCCSGVAVSEDLFLTNWHCGGAKELAPKHFWNEDVCARAIIDFSWDGDASGQEYKCDRVLAMSQELDYALLLISPLAGAGPLHPALVGNTVSQGTPLRLIHHMACLPKQVSDNCHVLQTPAPGVFQAADMTRLFHDCGSNPGSSGSPLFDVDGKVVALHHQGRERDSDTCAEKTGDVNKAIRIEEIVKSIGACDPEVADRIMRRR